MIFNILQKTTNHFVDMNTKVKSKNNDLVSIINTSLGWHKARATFLAVLIKAMLQLQTVNFIKLSQGIESNVKTSSNLRRIQRFFSEYLFSEETIAKLLFAMLPFKENCRLCLDRTNWKFGETNINILMLSVAYQGISFPIMWKMLAKRGNSNSEERNDLINRFIHLFGTNCIESLLADREFIGEQWFDELLRNNIPFYIRIKENMWINVPGKGRKKAFWLFNDLPLNKEKHYYKPVSYRGRELYLSGARVIGKNKQLEFVIIATYKRDLQALTMYKQRWQIETMFKAFKSSGFNLEETHLTNIDRISKLVAVICIAFSWAYIIGVFVHLTIKMIVIKKHGRKAMSFFKYGLNFIANVILNRKTNDYNKCVKLLSCT